jgi:acyl carrier protein
LVSIAGCHDASHEGKATELQMENVVRLILKKHTSIGVEADTLKSSINLFDVGMSSFAAVQVMMGLEEVLGVEFPDEMLTRRSFETIDALTAAVNSLDVPPCT